ncbi:LOW QUALITY PROTEIN: hypothetical protein HID58_086241, partial [Brassica napus]
NHLQEAIRLLRLLHGILADFEDIKDSSMNFPYFLRSVLDYLRKFHFLPSELHNRGMLGAQHALDPLTTVKACVNNAGIALIQHGWHPMSFITISGEIDSRAIEKSSMWFPDHWFLVVSLRNIMAYKTSGWLMESTCISVSFDMELFGSNSSDEQLTGVRILRQFAVNEWYSGETLEKIIINVPVVERSVEMLKRSAADILSKLASKQQNSLRVAGISGAMETIFSEHEIIRFNSLGLLILKKLAKDHDNCGNLGNTRGFLPRIIDFTHVDQVQLWDENADVTRSQVLETVVQLVKMLVSTTENTWKAVQHFLTYGDDGNQGSVRIAAGRLVEALEVPSICVNVASL